MSILRYLILYSGNVSIFALRDYAGEELRSALSSAVAAVASQDLSSAPQKFPSSDSHQLSASSSQSPVVPIQQPVGSLTDLAAGAGSLSAYILMQRIQPPPQR
jgi:hypothetical protein